MAGWDQVLLLFFFSSLQLLHKKEMEILMTETQNLGGILPCSNLKVPPAVVCVTGVLPSFHFAGSLPTGGNRALPYFLCEHPCPLICVEGKKWL